MELTAAQLRYLFAIYQLSREQTEVSSSAVADSLSVTRASTARMLTLFVQRELIAKTRYSKITLTPVGLAAAEAHLKRHAQLARMLREQLALQPAAADAAAATLLCTLPDLPPRR